MPKTARERNITTSDQLTTVLSYGAILLLGYLVYKITAPFLVPLAWSAVLAIFFYPLHERVKKRLKPNSAAVASTLAVTVLLIVPAVGGSFLHDQTSHRCRVKSASGVARSGPRGAGQNC